MKHSSSRDLFVYWDSRRGDRPAPARADIDPAAIRHALGDVFMLAADFVEEPRFRLAGTRICALFTREVKGESFNALWSEASRPAIKHLLSIVDEEAVGAVAGATGHAADGATVDLEILLLPLAHEGHARIRALGVLAANDPPYWIGENPLKELDLGSIRHLGATSEQGIKRPFMVTAGGGQMRRGFMVYQGGRTTPPNEQTG